MVSRFTLLAPWWARWLVNAAASTATLAVVAAAMFPRFPTPAAWQWNAVAVVAAGVTPNVPQDQIAQNYESRRICRAGRWKWALRWHPCSRARNTRAPSRFRAPDT